MRAVYRKTARILSSKARPNIPVGLYLIREPPDSDSSAIWEIHEVMEMPILIHALPS